MMTCWSRANGGVERQGKKSWQADAVVRSRRCGDGAEGMAGAAKEGVPAVR